MRRPGDVAPPANRFGTVPGVTLRAVQDGPAPGRRRRRWSIGLAIGALLGLAVSVFLPCPYVVESPGPVFNALGRVAQSGGRSADVVQVRGAATYPTSGRLDVLTVSVLGTPDQQPSWGDVVAGWFRPHSAVTPMEAFYAPGTTTKQTNAATQQQMTQSQQDAVAAALRQLGYTVPATARVAGFGSGASAAGVLRKGDVIVAVDGQPAASTTQLRAAAKAHGTAGTPLSLLIERDGQQSTVQVKPTRVDGIWAVGVLLSWSYDFPVRVSIHLADVGGPSAGLTFALATVDRLSPESLTGGQHIAGTGTMSPTGEVGAIGGIRQKMVGARSAGARWFLAPTANCDEVVGHVPAGLHVVAVSTLDQAVTDLQTIAASKSAAGLRTCR